MTEYDEVVMIGGGRHPLAGVPQEALNAATRELRDILEDDFDSSPSLSDLEVWAHAILAAALEKYGLQQAMDDSYQNGIVQMQQVAESVIGTKIPRPQGELF